MSEWPSCLSFDPKSLQMHRLVWYQQIMSKKLLCCVKFSIVIAGRSRRSTGYTSGYDLLSIILCFFRVLGCCSRGQQGACEHGGSLSSSFCLRDSSCPAISYRLYDQVVGSGYSCWLLFSRLRWTENRIQEQARNAPKLLGYKMSDDRNKLAVVSAN